ncbi:hypothetical protein KKE19_04530 [Patescibacteria group bacterium]|nr:hypothetical protein [Patescibacteria group bacterium]MBU4275046.1 hypothetical protein [Patescibacteria group bacterium]MBU4367479.1 hypothetical protein [Patescibacteria group bacterium]MBU4462085.1 hypothetical protein [Patescibacteria group bacterium]MCG2700471.1 hypothetical protein [Candidatus Parcubacteria bacterium]
MVSAEKKTLPQFFKPLFWYCDFSKLNIQENEEEIIIQVINYGDWRHWQWLFKYYGREKSKEIIENIPISAFRERALKLVSLLLKINKLKYVSRSHRIKEAKSIPET